MTQQNRISLHTIHHTLPGHFHGHNNILYQNLRRGACAYFILIDLCWYDTIGCSVLATKSDYHQSSFITLNLNTRLLIPIDELFVVIILPFVAILNHDSLFTLFTLHSMAGSIPRFPLFYARSHFTASINGHVIISTNMYLFKNERAQHTIHLFF